MYKLHDRIFDVLLILDQYEEENIFNNLTNSQHITDDYYEHKMAKAHVNSEKDYLNYKTE